MRAADNVHIESLERFVKEANEVTAIPSALRIGAVLVALGVPLPVGAVDIEYVAVRDADNPPDTPTNCRLDAADCGSVPYDYAISKYEITNGEYVQFLNEVANEVDAFGLYDPNMGGIDFPPVPIGFERFYVVQPGSEEKPVDYVSFYDALRFANWLHNGQPRGLQDATTTEDGAYTITALGIAGNSIVRNTGATVFLPNENEWYKAAYYDAASASFFKYPTGTNAVPASDAPPGGANSANFFDGAFALTGSASYDSAFDYRNDVGAYTGSASPYGTFDQGGNLDEWNETVVGGLRGLRGGSWDGEARDIAAEGARDALPGSGSDLFGFRVARPVPEPAQLLLELVGGLVLSAAQRQRRA